MPWSRMRFRGDLVWVQTNEQGRLVLDGDGRAEMKYRIEDPRSYRPGAGNLTPAPDAANDAPPVTLDKKVAARPRRAAAGAKKAAPRSPGAVPSNTVQVWTDGACSGNPGPMGIGMVVLADGTRRERGEFLGNGTNNIAELVAIERGLEIAAEIEPDLGRPIRVYSDSGYAIGLLSQNWKAKANQELVARLRRVTTRIPDLGFVKVAGHAGVPENERCDELARMAIEKRGTV